MQINIFSYLKDEEALAMAKLEDLVNNFQKKDRETVFDEVKFVGDQLRGYLKKQSVLLLKQIETQDETISTLVKATEEKEAQLLGDMENLVMVHVDEPGYRDYLANLQQRARDYFKASNNLYNKLNESLPSEVLEKMNETLRVAIHSDVGFNSLQTLNVQVTKASRE